MTIRDGEGRGRVVIVSRKNTLVCHRAHVSDIVWDGPGGVGLGFRHVGENQHRWVEARDNDAKAIRASIEDEDGDVVWTMIEMFDDPDFAIHWTRTPDKERISK